MTIIIRDSVMNCVHTISNVQRIEIDSSNPKYSTLKVFDELGISSFMDLESSDVLMIDTFMKL